MTESQVLRRCQHGAPQAFRHLAHRCQDDLFRTATLITGNQSLAEFQVRESLRTAWRRTQSVGLGAPIRLWLLHSLIRQEATRTPASSNPADRSRHRDPLGIPPPPQEPGELDRKSNQLHRALASLDPAHRHILILRYYANCTVPQLAVVLGVPEDTVETTRRHALGQLRRRLRAIVAYPHDEPDISASDQALIEALRDYFRSATAALQTPGDLWDVFESRAPDLSCTARIRRRVLAAVSRYWTPLSATGAAAALASAVMCASTA